MATVAIQTQCCLSKTDNDWEDDDDEADSARGGRRCSLWSACLGMGALATALSGAPPRSQAAVPRSLSEATTIVPSGRG